MAEAFQAAVAKARARVDCVSQKKPGRSWKPGFSQQGETLIAVANEGTLGGVAILTCRH